jgi:exosortase A
MITRHSVRLGVVAAPAATVAGWRPTLALIGAALLIFAVGFHRDAVDAVRVWIGSTAYNHCFLVLPVIGYLLWERRQVIRAVSPEPVLWPLALMPLFSAAWLVAGALDINEARQLLVVAMFELVLLTALGPLVFRALMAPLLFLFFLVPFGAFLVPWLQSVTADIAVAGLRLFHVPVFSDSNLIAIPQGSFEIAEACAGLRFLIAASVFSCLFSVLTYRSPLRRAIYIALSVAAAIAANGVRCWGIIMLAHFLGSAAASETDHILYGWLFFSLVILLLIGIGLLMAEKPSGAAAERPTAAADPLPRRHMLAVPLAALLALGGPAFAAWRDHLSAGPALDAAVSPSVAAPWHAAGGQPVDWRPGVVGAGREFLETFAGMDGAVVTRFVALYPLRVIGNALTSTENRVACGRLWRIVRQAPSRIVLNGERIGVTRSEIVGGDRRLLVWSFYVVDGRIAGGLLDAKLLQLRAVLHRRHPIGAFVAVATRIADDADSDRRAADRLTRFLRANPNLRAYVAALARETVPAA